MGICGAATLSESENVVVIDGVGESPLAKLVHGSGVETDNGPEIADRSGISGVNDIKDGFLEGPAFFNEESSNDVNCVEERGKGCGLNVVKLLSVAQISS